MVCKNTWQKAATFLLQHLWQHVQETHLTGWTTWKTLCVPVALQKKKKKRKKRCLDPKAAINHTKRHPQVWVCVAFLRALPPGLVGLLKLSPGAAWEGSWLAVTGAWAQAAEPPISSRHWIYWLIKNSDRGQGMGAALLGKVGVAGGGPRLHLGGRRSPLLHSEVLHLFQHSSSLGAHLILYGVFDTIFIY